jgi:hypothetical protein
MKIKRFLGMLALSIGLTIVYFVTVFGILIGCVKYLGK